MIFPFLYSVADGSSAFCTCLFNPPKRLHNSKIMDVARTLPNCLEVVAIKCFSCCTIQSYSLTGEWRNELWPSSYLSRCPMMTGGQHFAEFIGVTDWLTENYWFMIHDAQIGQNSASGCVFISIDSEIMSISGSRRTKDGWCLQVVLIWGYSFWQERFSLIVQIYLGRRHPLLSRFSSFTDRIPSSHQF